METAIGRKAAVSDRMQAAMQQWSILYSDISEKEEQKKGLHLASSICTEFSRLIFAESELRIDGNGKTASFLQDLLERFLPILQTNFGMGLALGGLTIKPYFANGEVCMSMIPADRIFPLSFSEYGTLMDTVFVEPYVQGDIYYTRLEYHTFQSEQHIAHIDHYTFRSQQADMLGVPCELSETPWKGLEPFSNISANAPLFGYFKVPKANTVDPTSPMGVSVFATAIPQILQADKLWDSILWEYESKETAIFATQDMFNRFDCMSEHDKRLYKMLMHGEEGKIVPFSPEIRDGSLFNGFQHILQRIEFACHFAYGTLSEPVETEKTATEIKMAKQRSYIFVSALQKQVETAIRQALQAAAVLAAYHGMIPSSDFTLSCNWGDSVLEDTDARFQRHLQLAQAGYLKPEILIAEEYGCDTERALEMIPQQPSAADFSLFGGDR